MCKLKCTALQSDRKQSRLLEVNSHCNGMFLCSMTMTRDNAGQWGKRRIIALTILLQSDVPALSAEWPFVLFKDLILRNYYIYINQILVEYILDC